jgi:hypothetical protein
MMTRVLRVMAWLAIAGAVAWIASNMSFKPFEIPAPLRGEASYNPYYAAIRMSSELGAEASWERVFTQPPADSVIFLSDWTWSLSKPRRERLQKWVEDGGRLVIDNTVVGDFEAFENWSGIGRREKEAADKDEDEETHDQEDSHSDNPSGKRSLAARLLDADCHKFTEDGSGRKLELCDVDWAHTLTSSRQILWALRENGAIHAVRAAVGHGSVTVLNASPFRYRDFLLGDHPRLFVAATQLRRGDTLQFLTEEDQASILSLTWRFGAPAVLLLLAAVALGLWRSGVRFGPRVAVTQTARRSLAEQIRGTGQFALRFGGGEALHAATLRALREAAIRRLPSYDHMSSTERVTAIAKASGIGEADLGPAMNYAGPRNSHELREAIAVLETARRRLLLMRKKINGN